MFYQEEGSLSSSQKNLLEKHFGVRSVIRPTIAPYHYLPPITPVIDFGKPGGARPSGNPPRLLYSRGSDRQVFPLGDPNGNLKRALQHVRPKPYACPASSLLSFPTQGWLSLDPLALRIPINWMILVLAYHLPQPKAGSAPWWI